MKNILPEKVYDWLKWICVICLPAVSTFVVVLGQIYHFEDIAGMVSQTITAIATLIGSLICVSSIQYKKGADADVSG